MEKPTQGETYTFERAFTTGEVRRFAALSRDEQRRHTDPDPEGRLLVHGLLTATLPTKIGGDHDVLASSISFEFRQPVYTGETITCLWTYENVLEREDRYDLVVDVACENGSDETVLLATVEGLIWKR
jgi:acyl dehydratase